MTKIIYTGCPNCGAQSEDEAQTMCCGSDDCSMSRCDDWQESLDYVNKMADFDLEPEENKTK